eukprot:6201984-Pleurochrysis_carterae.AAC.1
MPTNPSPSCLRTICAPRKPRATVGTPFASDWPPGCSAQDAQLVLYKPCADDSRPNRSPSTVGLKRPSMSVGSQPRRPHTLTPLRPLMSLSANFASFPAQRLR